MFSNRKEVDNCINESCESVASECTSKRGWKIQGINCCGEGRISNGEVCGN